MRKRVALAAVFCLALFVGLRGASTLDLGTPIINLGNATGFPARAWFCSSPGLGDGLNAMVAGTYLQTNCYNGTGATVTLTGFKAYTDNNGTSTCNVTNGAATALLTGAITATTSYASGTQSATVTLANADFLKFTFVTDGTSKQISCIATGTY